MATNVLPSTRHRLRAISRLVVEAEVADAHDVAGHRTGLGQGLVDAELLQPVVDVGERVEVGEVGQGDGPHGGPAVDAQLVLVDRSISTPSGVGPVDDERLGLGLGGARLLDHHAAARRAPPAGPRR